MILDTSAVVALAVNEAAGDWVRAALDAYPQEFLRMAWVNIVETGMVLERITAGVSSGLQAALDAMGVEPLATDYPVMRIAVAARSRFPLNFGDCFAYAHAHVREEILLTLDADFLATDLPRVLHPERPLRQA